MKTDVYNQSGEKVGTAEFPKEVFGLPWNPALIHQVMLAMLANKRAGTAHAKTRAEVRGGGRKPWRQKGLGRARHGSIRSPIWRGGGVTFGPRKERIYKQKINKKMKAGALLDALSQKARDKEILVLDKITTKESKTKEAAVILKALSKIKGFEKLTRKKNAALILISAKGGNENLKRAFRNLPGIIFVQAGNLNLLDVLNHKYLVFSREAVGALGPVPK